MKSIIMIFISLLMCYNYSFADTLTVKQDGSGTHTYIMQAIVNVLDGDVIIVYPGIYNENINFIGRNFTLASTYLINPIDSIRYNTIIDGGGLSSCIRMVNGEQNSRIIGFTIQNGSGSSANGGSNYGGGIYFRDCSAKLEKCIIKNNSASSGGGIMIWNSDITLTANTIKNNRSNLFGGGIFIEISSNVVFDSILLNNVYLNFSQIGTDICKYFESVTNHIILDTATVASLNDYYLYAMNSNMFPVTNNMTFEAVHGIVEQVNADLYVNPDGDNNNSGLSIYQPLKTISYALAKIISDSINNNTIHLSPGTYSSSLSGEKYPLCFKSNVPIIGSGREITILDAENKINFGNIGRLQNELILKNFSFIRGNGHNMPFMYGGLWIDNIKKLVLDSLHFQYNRSYYQSCTSLNEIDSVFIKNCVFKNNRGISHMNVHNSFRKKDTYFSFVSNIYQNNYPDSTSDQSVAIVTSGLGYLVDDHGKIHGNLISCLIADNESYNFSTRPTNSGILIVGNANTTLVNSTIGNNKIANQKGGAVLLAENANANLYNCVVFSNDINQICLFDDEFYYLADSLFVYNSCIENGYQGIFDYGQYNFVFYDEATNTGKDPLWLNQGEFPYAISNSSPCLDAGTLNLPDDIELPQSDLAGNQRIWGATIDMGAYEWWPVDVEYNSTLNNVYETKLIAAPNPMSTSTNIMAKFGIQGHAKIEVFDNFGRMVKVLMNMKVEKGKSVIKWIGDDDNHNLLPPGIYYVILFQDDKEIDNLKLIKR